MKTIAVCSPSFCKSEDLRLELKKVVPPPHQLVFCDASSELRGVDLVKFLQDAAIALVGKEELNADILEQLPSLKAISKYGVGLDNIDLEACKKKKIKVHWQAGTNADSVAEHTIALILAVIRNIARSDRYFHQGVWWKNGGRQLRDRKVGIVGFGEIGSRVASLLKAFDCEIFVCEIDPKKSSLIKKQGFKLLEFEELLSNCDIITFHVPLDASTLKMMNSSSFGLLKSDAVLINTSRGKVFDQEALKNALRFKKIGGAGIDVFVEEPVFDRELFSLDGLVATAHMAGNSAEAIQAMGKAAIDGVQKFLL